MVSAVFWVVGKISALMVGKISALILLLGGWENRQQAGLVQIHTLQNLTESDKCLL